MMPWLKTATVAYLSQRMHTNLSCRDALRPSHRVVNKGGRKVS